MNPLRPISTIALAVLVGPGAEPPEPLGGVRTGDRPYHHFSDELVNGAGVRNLMDLEGRPVLVEFWGTHCGACVGRSVPSALKLAEKYGDDLAVLFVESQGATPDAMELFVYDKEWMGTGAMWTTEAPFRTSSRRLPCFALLSGDGEVLLVGESSKERKKEIEKAIAAEIITARKGPEGTPRSLQRAWGEFADGKYAQALASARKLIESESDGPAALATVQVFERRLRSRMERASRLTQMGHYAEAEELLRGLSRGVRGLDQEAAAVDRILSWMECSDFAPEMTAARGFEKLRSRACSRGLDASIRRDLMKFMDRHPGTRAAGRARHLLEISGP